ncbi:F-box/FBD/LRR-repeat protein At4g26340-like [Lotus japonicus]|uniref:F-box/FBD/LRR-repeat protein At4g26340-like n=1 Tax=Lotus japonicus TaxID=34305 RepID=UPI002584261E|nr:F-box/FBD/LRR-repeat protein At4g26340-like [Lotus japonicus]
MVDRISRLSDELLTHILSFLSTEEAVATSVLSKRWRPLWTSVPVLDYDDEIYLRNGKPSYCFERFVYATILPRDLHQPITSFRLKYGASAAELFEGDVIYDRSNADINIWVNTVIRRGIQNLDIEIYPTNLYFSLSCSSVSCRTLVVLKLNGLSLNVSSSVGLPSLKSLHVETVQFEEPNYLMGLLFGCPLLEDLKICYIDYVQDSYFLNEQFNNLHFPKLVRANLLHVNMAGHDTTILLKAVCNVEFLCIHQFRADFVVPEFPHVRHLGLFFVTHNWRVVLLMLKNCPNLQSFKLNLN